MREIWVKIKKRCSPLGKIKIWKKFSRSKFYTVCYKKRMSGSGSLSPLTKNLSFVVSKRWRKKIANAEIFDFDGALIDRILMRFQFRFVKGNEWVLQSVSIGILCTRTEIPNTVVEDKIFLLYKLYMWSRH